MYRRRFGAAALLLLPLLPRPAGALAPAPVAEPAAAQHGTARNPAVRWLAGWVVEQLVSYGVGKALDAAVSRLGLAGRAGEAAANLRGLGQDASLSAAERQEARRLAGQMDGLAALLRRNELNDAALRAEVRRMQGELREMRQRIAVLDRRIAAVEEEQRRHMRILVDHEARIIRVEDRMEDHDERLGRVERTVFPDSNRYLRHESYLSAGALYANSVKLGNDAAVGFEVAGQYNFNQFFGAFGGVQFVPLHASDVEGMPPGSAVEWEGLNAHLGGVVSLAPPRQPVSLQLGVGGGIAQSELLYFAPDADRTQRQSAEPLGSSANVYMLVKAELGVAPPAFEFEPVISAGYMGFADDLAFVDESVASNAGRGMWYLSVGLRWRQYLRGRPTPR